MNETRKTPKKVGFDDLLEDLFGLNMRAAKSIWTLFVRPRDYFLAARDPNWNDETYTPSLRIWLGLMAILIGLQFIWAGDSSEYMNAMIAMPDGVIQAVEAQLDDGEVSPFANFDRLSAARDIIRVNMLIYPFIFILTMSLVAVIFRVWPNGENFVVRQRYVFGTLVPATTFGLFWLVVLLFAEGKAYAIATYIQLFVLLLLYVVTAYRGPMADMDKRNRFGLSCVMAFLMIVALLLAQTISLLIASLPTFFDIFAIAEAAKAARP